MASNTIFATLQTACSSHHFIRKQHSVVRTACSSRAKQESHVVVVESDKILNRTEPKATTSSIYNVPKGIEGEAEDGMDTESSPAPKFKDERWKNGTWDLNLFVKDGKMDWDDVIVAEARRRKLLQMYPQTSTNKDPVLFRSSIIPWWAWIRRFHLPEAELINGRAAMIGFFMAYLVYGLTGIGVVGQTGNFICKAGLFATVAGILLFRKTDDIANLQNLVNEATFYDKQWQFSWQTKEQEGEPKN